MQRKQDLGMTLWAAFIAIAMVGLVAISIYSRPAAASARVVPIPEVEWNDQDTIYTDRMRRYVITHNSIPGVRVAIWNTLLIGGEDLATCYVTQVTEILDEQRGEWRQISQFMSMTAVGKTAEVMVGKGGNDILDGRVQISCQAGPTSGSLANTILHKPSNHSNLMIRVGRIF